MSPAFSESNGEAYGYFVLDQRTITYALAHLNTFAKAPETRLALLINLNENRLHGRVDGLAFARMLISNLKTETEPLIISTSIAYLNEMALHGQIAGSEELEESLLGLARKPGGKGCQQAAFRACSEPSGNRRRHRKFTGCGKNRNLLPAWL